MTTDAPRRRGIYARVRSCVPAWVRRWLWRFVVALAGLMVVDLAWAMVSPGHTARVAEMLIAALVRCAAAVVPGFNS